jgi:hypothetical protein
LSDIEEVTVQAEHAVGAGGSAMVQAVLTDVQVHTLRAVLCIAFTILSRVFCGSTPTTLTHTHFRTCAAGAVERWSNGIGESLGGLGRRLG